MYKRQAYAAGGSSAAAAGPGSDSWEARRAPLRGPRATAPLPAGALDFRSKFFNPLEVRRKVFKEALYDGGRGTVQ